MGLDYLNTGLNYDHIRPWLYFFYLTSLRNGDIKHQIKAENEIKSRTVLLF